MRTVNSNAVAYEKSGALHGILNLVASPPPPTIEDLTAPGRSLMWKFVRQLHPASSPSFVSLSLSTRADEFFS